MSTDNIVFIVISLFIAIPPTIGIIFSILIGIKNTNKIHAIHIDMNSRFDEWMEMVKTASFAEGVKSVKDTQKENVDKSL
jgi:5-enolpyruvylshikimate-3-phosphate synthase